DHGDGRVAPARGDCRHRRRPHRVGGVRATPRRRSRSGGPLARDGCDRGGGIGAGQHHRDRRRLPRRPTVALTSAARRVAIVASMSDEIGTQFVKAVATKDTPALRALLAPDVDFRALTPNRFWEAKTADAFLDEAYSVWFDDNDNIERVESIEHA